MDSILQTIKKLLGITEECKSFDLDIMIHINSVFSELTQLGVGPEKGFSISDEYTAWTEFISSDSPKFEMVKSYIFLNVKLLFDPPPSSAAVDSINRQINEMEWRLNVAAETK